MFRLAFALALLAATPALAAGCDPVDDIRFAPGTTSGGVPRGEMACYGLTARAGQRLEVTISSTEDNAVFQIYAPGWRNSAQDGPQGTALPGAEPGSDATRFAGPLPANGRYLIVVGATRGGTSYRLWVAIR